MNLKEHKKKMTQINKVLTRSVITILRKNFFLFLFFTFLYIKVLGRLSWL